MNQIFEAVNGVVFPIWFLIGVALVFFMQGGFAMVETGFTRAKNAGNIIMKNLMDFCIGTVVFVFLGFSLMMFENYLFEVIGVPKNTAHPDAKMTKVTIVTSQNKFGGLQKALDGIGITGITVTNVLGYGMQKGYPQLYRGVPVEAKLLPKIQIDIVISKISTEVLVKTVKKALYTGNVGDGKIFIYNVENVIKVRTGEEGYDALQDEESLPYRSDFWLAIISQALA